MNCTINPRLALVTALAGASCLAAAIAPAADAMTVERDGSGRVVVTAAPGEQNGLSIQASTEDPSGRIILYDFNATSYDAGPGCTAIPDWHYIECALTPAAGVVADLGDGDDRASVSGYGLPAGVPIAISGGAGRDELEASIYDGENTTLVGGAGDDTIGGGPGANAIDGGDGNDRLEGNGGPDQLHAGAGDDTLIGDGIADPAADVIDGGPGTDKVSEDWRDPSYDAPVHPLSITLAGGADDGREGEGDELRSIEKVVVNEPGTYVGTEGADDIELFQVLGVSSVSGGGGDDRLKASDGKDTIDGGAGNDEIDAGFGDDQITGGPGADSIQADTRGGDCGPIWCKYPFGNDTIETRDGARDSIDCGAGTDTVNADPVDVVAPNCEQAEIGGAPATAAGCVVPKVVGLKAAAAKRKLAKASCKVKVRKARSSRVKRGRVIKVSPRAGKRLAGGAKVTLTVSKGRR